MYYPRFTKVIIHHFMSKDPSIPRRNKVNWHYVRDDFMFSTIKLVSIHQNTQQFGVLLPIELTNDEIRNSSAYKEYYAIATGEAAPKPKASVRRARSGSDTSITPSTAAVSPRLTASTKGKQTTKHAADAYLKLAVLVQLKELVLYQGFPIDGEDDNDEDDDGEKANDDEQEVVRDVKKDDAEESGDNDDEEGEGDEQESDKETRDEESFNPIPQTPEDSKDEGNDKEDQGLNVGGKDMLKKMRKMNSIEMSILTREGSSSVSSQFVTSMLNPTRDVGMESIFETTSRMDVQTPTSVAPLPITTPMMTSSTISTTKTISQAPILPTTVPSDIIQNLPSFGSLFRIDVRLRSLEENFSEVMQTNQFAGAVSAIPGIVQQYMDQRMNEAVKVVIQIQSDRLREEAQSENDKFFRTVDENIKKIIKEHVKEQVKVQVSKMLPRIKKAVNEQLEAKVLPRSSHSSMTSYDVAADLSEKELKNILIEKIGGNKSIQRSNEQRNLYKALAEAYESDKIILDTYGETVTLKRRRDDDEDKDEEPSAGLDQRSKRRREGKEPESASALLETATRSAGRVDTLTPELLAGPTYELMKGLCKSLIELEYHLKEVYKATIDQLDWVNPERSTEVVVLFHLSTSSTTTSNIFMEDYVDTGINRLRQACPLGVSYWGRKCQQFYGFAINRESACDVYSKKRIIAVTKLNIVEWHSYKHLDWITVRRDDDKLYKFKEGFIYQNKDKKNRLMQIDELYKLSDRTLIDVRTALDDCLKGIRMRYLPQTIWRKSDKDRAAAMIQAIDKRLKTRRIMRSLERFVGGRLYEGDFRMLQRTI
uniref:Uncharacterized protein n=1 Tax=Tanacetum cinerariifolium TaxID=118510 RepID=A0A699J1G0_TANCI|nr:hypothetical protein [Tanacetum cinerariifolium]